MAILPLASRVRSAIACALVLLSLQPLAAGTARTADGPETLRQKLASLKANAAGRAPFDRPLYMESNEGRSGVTGEIYALVDHPFAGAGVALRDAARWCDMLILHINTKYCRATTDSRETRLQVRIGKKIDQPVEQAYRLDLAYRVVASTPDYLQVNLDADTGPLGTRDYRIVFAATPAEGDRTFVRLSYSYGYGTLAGLAMSAYLGTIGRDKVGFTVIGRSAEGEPRYIGGMRGVVERNTMRYYLAVESFLGALSAPPAQRLERSLRAWYAASERYPRQLHEIEPGEYFAMKRKEYLRQQPGGTPGLGSARGGRDGVASLAKLGPPPAR